MKTHSSLHTGSGDRMLVCAWCGAVMREGVPPLSHGICATCTELDLPSGPLTLVPAEELERLPFGVIRLSGDGVIEAYNRVESCHSRQSPPSVLGKNFFTDVAPCTDVQGFHGRLERMRALGEHGCERFSFAFRLPWTTVTVALSLSYDPITDKATVIVDWPPEAGARA